MFGTLLSGSVEAAVAAALASGPAGTAVLGGVLAAVEEFITSTSGPLALVTVFVYSFLIAFVLPGPSEVVLAVVETDTLVWLPEWARLGAIMVISGTGKALGSVVAFHVGQEAKHAGPIEKRVRDSRVDLYEWSEKTAVKLAKKYGYAGLALALSVPFFPDTISIYAFAVLEEDYVKFAAATFAGSVGRLLVTIGIFAGGFAIGALPFAAVLLVLVGGAAAAWWLSRDDDGEEAATAPDDDPQPPPSGDAARPEATAKTGDDDSPSAAPSGDDAD